VCRVPRAGSLLRCLCTQRPPSTSVGTLPPWSMRDLTSHRSAGLDKKKKCWFDIFLKNVENIGKMLKKYWSLKMLIQYFLKKC
jgi:hypothetical protein